MHHLRDVTRPGWPFIRTIRRDFSANGAGALLRLRVQSFDVPAVSLVAVTTFVFTPVTIWALDPRRFLQLAALFVIVPAAVDRTFRSPRVIVVVHVLVARARSP